MKPGLGSRGSLRFATADIAIVGAGPAGIAAATAAAEAGASVLVIDANARPGGQIWRHHDTSSLPRSAASRIRRLERCGAHLLPGASVVDARLAGDRADGIEAGRGGLELDLEQGTAALRVSARRLIIATGARERMLPFPGWTLPGVIGIGGAQALREAGVSFDGKRVAIAGTGPLLLAAASSLSRAGAKLVLVADQASARSVAGVTLGLVARPLLALQAVRHRFGFRGARYRLGTWVTRAEGDDRVRAVTVTDGTRTWSLPCDVLCSGYGLVPATELARLLGCEQSGGAVAVDERQRTSIGGVFAAGESVGIGGVDVALLEGRIAGLAAARRDDDALKLVPRRRRARAWAMRLENAFALRSELHDLPDSDTIVCRCEDVRWGALERRWSPRQARLYARVGMGPCQGRVCRPALETLLGWPADSARPPLEPMLVSTLVAGGSAPATAVQQGEHA